MKAICKVCDIVLTDENPDKDVADHPHPTDILTEIVKRHTLVHAQRGEL